MEPGRYDLWVTHTCLQVEVPSQSKGPGGSEHERQNSTMLLERKASQVFNLSTKPQD
jgi:hypothetical protein